MITSLYMDRHSFLHQLSPMVKILAIIIATILLLIFKTWWMLGAIAFFVLSAYLLAKISPWEMLQQLRFAIPILFFFFIFQLIIHPWQEAVFVIIRLMLILLMGNFLTLTTTISHMMDSMEYHLRYLAHLGANPAKISLAFSLCLRFIPVIAIISTEVRQAQKARGLEKNMFALIIPVIIRTLKMADAVADAIEARSYGS